MQFFTTNDFDKQTKFLSIVLDIINRKIILIFIFSNFKYIIYLLYLVLKYYI